MWYVRNIAENQYYLILSHHIIYYLILSYLMEFTLMAYDKPRLTRDE